MAYTTTNNIYTYTPLTESQVSEEVLTKYILDATTSLNKDINSKITRERVSYIDSVRENKIDDSNKTYYVQKSKCGVYFGDMNNDGEISVSDITVHIVNSDDTETIGTISSIDNDDMSITLDTAPASNTQAIYITYAYTYFDVTIPDMLIEMATRYLAAAYGFMKDENGLGDNVKIGNISVTGMNKKSGYLNMYSRFEDILLKIKGFSNAKDNVVSLKRI